MISDKDILNARILIVDDQLINIKLLEKMLRQAGFTSLYSTNLGAEVKQRYFEYEIDLILLDIRMPDMDGFQVMESLHTAIHNDYLPILVITAELTQEIRKKSLSSGAKDFITKPFDQTEVIQRIRNMLEVRLLHKQVMTQNVTLEQQVKIRTQQLEQSRLEIIKRLGRAAEYKDNETGNHILRMSHFAEMLALAASLNESFAADILTAAPMHDIGKIGIPDHILLKPGKLNADEWEVMKTHVKIGADLLADTDVPLLKLASNIALTHHEKWDGSGYPNGLKGKDIPIEGRICAVCDVFDALTSERPYKKAWPIDKAVDYLTEQKGHHFDPELVEHFLSILEEVLHYRAHHPDTLSQTQDIA
ncbi:HD domain-containing phosphohydrolase [Methylophaga sulfidovorans]|uniref:Response regulator receiver modulated metal dependent phosphohydrolase n=1 Tax=Methylophaga sulfidovorans TaxID=45496 RepID=A0A1I3X5C5_9GAMM|nr:HD domain-containing phosphohydrolase [Methylophaga sulfidovorans]SFK14507.1 response regulator receiver modulated metal dependent phosphohydrolase [Methylophaga sulfidovorans]